ncbi:MAG: hypothetical protein M0Z46_10650 [Actinomycetota bacterium]|jgi:hypothetical protein|nr:hypothetical protein [Actinomycetota bacterium]
MTDLDLDAIKALTIIEWEDDDGEIIPLVCMDPDDRDTLVAEIERLREALGSCGGFISGLRDEYTPNEWRESQAHRLCLEIAAALHPQEPSGE